VTVKVQDNGSPPLSTNCFLNVAIEDVNDNSPSFDYINDHYQTNILGSVLSNRRVYRVYATDADAGPNGQVSYSLNTTTPRCRNCFHIDSEGWIRRGVGALQASTEVRELLLFLFDDNLVDYVGRPNGQFVKRLQAVLAILQLMKHKVK